MDTDALALVGVSCRFAHVADPGAFWRMLMQQGTGISPLGPDLALDRHAPKLFPTRDYPKYGATLDALYACVPRELTFPRQLNAGENQDLYFAVQLAFDALTDAGVRLHETKPARGTVRLGYAPLFNAATLNWLEHTFFVAQTMDVLRSLLNKTPEDILDVIRTRLIESLPPPNAESFLTGSGSRMATWIARECGFSGGATTLDAGTLSGIAALRAAMDDLRSGRANVALVGALMPPLSRSFLMGVSGEVTFSKQDQFLPYDHQAQGILPGEGGAFFVLKREADALQAHDRIYALVRSLACGHHSFEKILSTACARAHAPLTSIQLIEGTGEGTHEGDLAEVQALQTLWGEHRPGGPLVGLGSVKGNVGHCFQAASAAGLLKVALALRRKVLPPQIPTEKPLECLANLSSSVYLLNEARPWITGDPTSPRRAAVLMRDGSEQCAAVILEEEPTQEDRT